MIPARSYALCKIVGGAAALFEVYAASFPNVDCGAETALSRVSAESAYVSELPGIISPAFVGFVGEYIGA